MPEANQRKQEGSTQATPEPKTRPNLVTILVVGGLMLVEGVALLLAVNFMSDPQSSMAGQGQLGAGGQGNGGPSEIEVHVTDMSAFNDRGGVVYVYHLSVYARVENRHASTIHAKFENRSQTINDRLGRVIRSADPKYFDEPGLETLRRQFKHQLGEVLGDEKLIKEILFPEFSKTRAD